MKGLLGNLCLAAIGLFASFTLKDWAQIFAGFATGVYFVTATILALRRRERRSRVPRD
jgi:hypothetical protein